MSSGRRRSPAVAVLAVFLVLLLAGECVFLVWFVRTDILKKPAADSGDTIQTPDVPAPTTPDTPSEPDTPAEPDPPAEPVQPEPEQPAEPETPAEPEPPADPTAARAQEILSSMTLEEKIYQLFVVTPETLTGVGTATRAGETTRAALESYPVGGIVYFAKNLESGEQTRDMISATQSYSKLGLLICVDEEGGPVARLMDKLGTTQLSAMYTYKDDGTDTAQGNAATIGRDILSYGFNTDFAPVADVWSNPNNTVIGRRAYSDDFSQAAELVAAAVQGFHDAGAICTLKHFPGHGDTNEDSHTSSALVTKTHDELSREEWLPFASGIAAGADMVMVVHLTVPDIDDQPATLSRAIVTGCLRGELGFDGVVITDSLVMEAVSGLYAPGELCVRALEAGCDLLLEPESLADAAAGIADAVTSGRLTEARIDESVVRILTLKLKYGILT